MGDWVDVVWEEFPDKSLERPPPPPPVGIPPSAGPDGVPLLGDCYLGAAVDTSLARATVDVCAAGRVDGGLVLVKLIGTVPIPDAVGFLAGQCTQPRVKGLIVDKRFDSATLYADLRDTPGVRARLVAPTAEQVAVASGRVLDMLAAGELRHTGQQRLRDAFRAARRRSHIASVLFARASGDDQAPFLAAVWAVWGAQQKPPPEADIFI